MQRALRNLLHEFKTEQTKHKDFHIVRFYSSYVCILNGRAVKATNPTMTCCPLADFLYKNIPHSKDRDTLKKRIIEIVNEKISRFGHFTNNRQLSSCHIAIPYGASEMLMYALRKKVIDAAVVVCDGAGTVVVRDPKTVQGIGARMNGVFLTSPIPAIIQKLEQAGSHVVFKDAVINQLGGVKAAAQLGYQKIAVTVNGCIDEDFSLLRKAEKEHGISLTILVVCTTGISRKRILETKKYADMVWSCASGPLREIIGHAALLQLSIKIPVFILTPYGLNLFGAYTSHEKSIKMLDSAKQFLISHAPKGKKIRVGNFSAFLSETPLPVRCLKEPR